MRRLFLTVHQWLGLASSLIVFILCLTGTVLALQGPIESWVNRDVLRVAPTGQAIPLETLVPRLAAAAEKPYTMVVVPQAPDEALQLRQGRAVTHVNPYTGEVLGGYNPAVREAFMVAFRLHRWLLLDTAIGRPITGVATIVFMVILVTGLLLWAPRRAAMLFKAMRFRPNSNWRGWNYDLHVVLGLYAAIPLLVMGLSAMNWSFRAPFQETVYRLLDGRVPASAPRAPEAAGPPVTALPYARVIEAANSAYPYAGAIRISLPASADAPIEVAKVHMPSAISMPYVDRLKVSMAGMVIDREPFAERSRGAQVLSLIKDIHVGTVFGGLSLAIYLFACLVGTSLPLTGMIHWWGKLQARRRARVRSVPPNEREPVGAPR